MTCAPPASGEPVGCSASSAALVASGSVSPSANSTGARIGLPASTDAASPVRQSRTSARITALGRDSIVREGYVASATPAASATGSPPATRVVFLVANTGNPSGGPLTGTSSPVWPVTGAVAAAVGVSVGATPPPDPPQPATSNSAKVPRTAARKRTKPKLAAITHLVATRQLDHLTLRIAHKGPILRVTATPQVAVLTGHKTAASYNLPR